MAQLVAQTYKLTGDATPMNLKRFIHQGVALGIATCVLIAGGCAPDPKPAADRTTFVAYLPVGAGQA